MREREKPGGSLFSEIGNGGPKLLLDDAPPSWAQQQMKDRMKA